MMTQRSLRIFLFLSLAAAFASATAAQPVSDQDAIQALVGDYIEGWREGDVELLARIFALEEGRVMWISDQAGEQVLKSMTFGEVLERRKSQPGYGLAWEMLALDVIDSELAVAKVSISRRGGSYVDILVLQKLAGVWRIVNKTFVVRTKPSDAQER